MQHTQKMALQCWIIWLNFIENMNYLKLGPSVSHGTQQHCQVWTVCLGMKGIQNYSDEQNVGKSHIRYLDTYVISSVSWCLLPNLAYSPICFVVVYNFSKITNIYRENKGPFKALGSCYASFYNHISTL